MIDPKVEKLKAMKAEQIAGSDLCATDGNHTWYPGILPDSTISEAVGTFYKNTSFALYRSAQSKAGFAVVAVVVDNNFVLPNQMKPEVMGRFFQEDSAIPSIYVKRYASGLDVVVLA